ncbi:UDP-N-acetylmuramate--L-alanine ligase [Bacillus sp. AFS015802]|uniref:UDP-N-acetylmuramate--L-alanine ligase n=1 Tax=Bacillus sp. AFS015802 TaxID=2033486 RepID=UPI000BF6B1A4|nr:UDP-N-acetylmuramate--L-alanine ligase [Bacillus sp. AFS015802]PFA69826.1 UDP-N-acetylmuramate--L-alanine ligase [Bacillus sp. AFS015802]
MNAFHFIGIKGAGMSPLAQILSDMGFDVQGSDIEKHIFTQEGLERRNIQILNFNSDNVKEHHIVVVGNAFDDDHMEVKKAKQLNLKIIRYHDLLGEYSEELNSIAVTGSHGKTSTTGLMAHVFNQCQPTSYLIGDGTGRGEKDSNDLIFEACEYKRHFLAYKPSYAVITNIDFDHPDYFKDLEEVFEAFQSFVFQVRKRIIAYGDTPLLRELKTKVPISYFGFHEDNDFQAVKVHLTDSGTVFEVKMENKSLGTFEIASYGNHNVLNALAVICVGYLEKKNMRDIREGLKSFNGVKRRFSEKIFKDQVIIDDYAHHPTEIAATISAVRQKYPDRKIVAIFQPHTFSRTQRFLDSFADSLCSADSVYLCEIFGSARENKGNVSIEELQNIIPDSILLKEQNISKLSHHPNSVLLFMGAGDIQKYQTAYENSQLV